MSLPELISQIHSDNSGIFAIPLGKLFSALKEFILWELIAPPKAISVVIGAAPLRGASVIVEDDHQSDISKGVNGDVENLHACLPDQLRVCLEVLLGDGLVVIEHLEGVGETDAVHLELVSDVHGDFPKGTTLQTIYAVSAHVCTRQIATSKLYSASCGIDYLDALRGEWKPHVFDVE